MELSLSCREVIRIVASGHTEHLAFSRLTESGVPSEMISHLALATTSRELWDREISAIALWRAFLSVLPSSVFEYPEAPCRTAIEKRLEFLLGQPADEELVENVLAIAKRIQLYQIGGRSTLTSRSIQPDSALHCELLKGQSHRCAACGYRFLEGDLYPDPSMGLNPKRDRPIGKLDRSPRILLRRAVLDHRLPVYLAGDNRHNIQILCNSCNSGKSDLILGFEGKSWFGGTRARDLIQPGSQLFYMVVRREGKCATCGRNPLQTELRIRRKDKFAADTYINLLACCTTCLGVMI